MNIRLKQVLTGVIGLGITVPLHASFLSGDALDTAAEVLSWVVIILAPTIGIALFWFVHVMPEKIAEKRKHPQAKAIQVLCLLSLVFGGLLWPIAWLWAYTKPVLYKMAYGTDEVAHEHGEGHEEVSPEDEIRLLRDRLAELNVKLAEQKGKGA
jgi:CBS domain containing-hemolysin-like protein